MALIRPEQLRNASYSITGSFTGSFSGDGSGLTGVGGDSFPYTGSAIVSGSLTVIGQFTASGLNYPTTDGDEKQLLSTDSSGTLSFDWADRTNIDVKNTSGVTLTLGTPVYITGYQGASIFQIAAASASIAGKMPAIGVLDQTLAPNDQGYATLLGALRGYDTSLLSVNDSLYVGEGVLTTTRPTGSALVQKIARVGNVANNGEITILGAGRSNDIPNILEGYVWIGNSDGVAVARPTSSIGVSAILPVKDEGTQITPAVSSFDFVGNGVTATAVGNNVTITIPGGTVPLFPFVGDAVITGSLEIVGTGEDLFLIKNQTNETILQVSQSGVVVLSTQSVELTTTAPNGGIYFTSASFFVGLD